MKPAALLASGAIVVAVVVAPLWLKRQSAMPDQVIPLQVPAVAATAPAAAPPAPKLLPRFVDVGTTTCAPCRVMLGVMEELEARCPDTLKVEFVHTGEDPEAAERLGIRAIPTQLFYAPDGKELFRHTGVMRAGDVVAKWAELGFALEPGNKVGIRQ